MKKITLLVLLFVISTTGFGQNLIVTLNNSNTESFPVADILSIKFGAAEMMLYELDGTTNTWNIDDIDNYAFEGTANIEEEVMVISEKLNVYPNPATDKITINFESNFSGRVTISILDVNGKEVSNLFEGMHNEVTQIEWSVNSHGNMGSGTYLCKIKTSHKIITKPIIIQ